MRKIFIPLFLIFIFTLKAQESIQTDRPDQTESPSITPKNFLQIESGFQYEKQKESKNTSHPTTLWKYGINENFDVHLLTEWNTEIVDNEKNSGIAPIAFGIKAKLTEEKGFLPKISLLGNLKTSNWGSPAFQTQYWAPSFRFLFQQKLSEKIDLGYNLGAEWNGETPDATGIYTLSLAYSLSDKLGGFTEIYGFINKFQKADHRIDAGFTYLLNNNLQIDASSGLGISKISPDYFLSCGISYRFPLQ